MKIVILSKRAPQQRDLWDRPYGRFYYLARGLADRGCQVHLVLLDYRGKSFDTRICDGLHWHSVPLMPNPLKYYFYVRKLAIDMDAGWVVGFSDTYFGICAERVAATTGCHSLVDAYDNYESYIPWLWPLHLLWRRAVRRSTAVTAAGPELLQFMLRGKQKKAAKVIEMAADPVFAPRPQQVSRDRLGLKLGEKIVAYVGSLHRSRGVDELLEVFNYLQHRAPDVQVVLSGFMEQGLELPANCNHLGYIDDESVIDLLASADVVLCANKPDRFGDFSYPVKVYEALAMGIPVVGFATRSLGFVMRDCSQNLVPYPDAVAMAEKCIELIENSSSPHSVGGGWLGRSEELLQFMRKLSLPEG